MSCVSNILSVCLKLGDCGQNMLYFVLVCMNYKNVSLKTRNLIQSTQIKVFCVLCIIFLVFMVV